MSIAELATQQPPNLKAGKLLILDIERMKGQAVIEFWDLGDFKNRRIHADDVSLWPRTICAAYKWYGVKQIGFAAEWADGGREHMLRNIWDAYDEADIVSGHNIQGFDSKKLAAEWWQLGFKPPSPYKTIDTLKVARAAMGNESNTLNALLTRVGLAGKTDRYDVEVARAALAGDRKAQKKLKDYNCGDVVASETLLDRLRGWIPNHPHNVTGTANDRPTCNQCWGDRLERNGTKLAQQITYVLYRCLDCGANVQGTRHSRAAVTRGAS